MIFEHTALKALVEKIFATAGCNPEEARRVATRLVESNLVGHDSHGVLRVPSYIQWLQAGKVFTNKSVRVVLENEVLAVLDGELGLGQTIGEQAMRMGIEKSTKYGVAVIALRNSGHLGRIGDWAEMAAEAGKVSVHFVNTSGAGMLVAPFGGIDRRLSACPISVGVPSPDGDPVILDMAGCTIAEGKIRVALNSGDAVAEGCLIDSEGNPTTDPLVFYADPPGAILPIAGHKGHGLLMAAEFLSGALTGSSCTNPKNAATIANGMLSIFMDPEFFGEAADFHGEVDRFIQFVKTSRPTRKGGEILMPGEIEQRTKAKRIQNGLEIDDGTWAQIHATCVALGVGHDFPAPRSDGVVAEGLSIPGIDPDD